MREILFRGKSKETGKWVYGSLIRFGDGVFVIVKDGQKSTISKRELESEAVVPKTVGMYTGRTDRRGKKIFEGDIFILPSKPYNAKLVVWDEAGFTIFTDYMGYESKAVIVIGNEHDNPSLAEEATW